MGGSGSGGERLGAGRKPKPKPAAPVEVTPPGVLRAIGGNPAAVRAAPPRAPAPEPVPALARPPKSLSRSEAAIWRREAPRAVRQRTLTDETVAGFVELCELVAMKNEIKARMRRNKGGAAARASEGLLRQYVRIGQRVDVLLARFKLTSFGKAEEHAPPAEKGPREINPWSAVV